MLSFALWLEQQELFLEMNVIDLTHTWKNKRSQPESVMVIAFRAVVWLLDRETQLHRYKPIVDYVTRHFPQAKYMPRGEADDVFEWIRENIGDALTGHLNTETKTLFLGATDVKLSPYSSPLIQKVVKALGVQRVQMDDEEETYDIAPHEIQGKLPEIMYHGTTTAYLPGILRFGLYPGKSPSNWRDLEHKDKIFLTSTFYNAEFHAQNASTLFRPGSMGHARGKTGIRGLPVILGVKVPDPSLIVPDYDIAVSAGDVGTYPQTYKPSYRFTVDSKRATKHSGVLAYKGRIPANFIVKLWIFDQEEWNEVNPNEYHQNYRKTGEHEIALAYTLYPDLADEDERERAREDEEYRREMGE